MPDDPDQRSRQEYFAPYVEPRSRGVELGPSYRPTFPKSAGWNVLVVDHCSAEELIEKYRGFKVPEWMVERIEPVDFVWSGGSYAQIDGLPPDLDFVVACHVIEHTPDLVQFFVDMSEIVKADGLLLVALPRRHLMFDYYRPLSTLGDAILAHHDPAAYEIKARVDQEYLESQLEGLIAWSPATLLESRARSVKPVPIRSEHELASLINQVPDWASPGAPYRDGHRWVFEPETFVDLTERLHEAGLIDFGIVDWRLGVGCEFLVVMQKGAPGARVETRPPVLEISAAAVDAEAPAGGVADGGAELEAQALASRLRAMESSTSWRVTSPLRALKARAQRFRRHR
jgi:SAM-dependent methyltransferase